MVYLNNAEELKKNNDMMAKTNANVAKKKKQDEDVSMPMGLQDTKAMSEFYAELLSYAPFILKDAV
jgi:hypothetical protein